MKNSYLRLNELKKVTGLSSSTLWRLEKRGEFPRRHRLSIRAVGWVAHEVEEWLDSRKLTQQGSLQ